jgi:N utilization substance protein A
MKSDFLIAVTQLASERGLPKEQVVGAVEAALVSAYKRDAFAAGYNITVRLDPNHGEVKVFVLKDVVEEVTDSRREMGLEESRKHSVTAVLGDTIETEATFRMSGRIAAQTAKQVVLQRLREAERELLLAEYAHRVGEILAGRVERMEPYGLIVSLGKTEALLPKEETVSTERYRSSQTLQFYLREVARTTRGPELILSRSHPDLVKRLFEREVPEISTGVVEINGIAREPGFRTKIAVSSRQDGVDPVGSCVGLRGIRIQNIVTELQGEKVDVIQWDESPAVLIGNALSPAQVLNVEFHPDEGSASVYVPERHLSLAIGREGQNVRLAAKLTGWRIDILGPVELPEDHRVEKAVAVGIDASTEKSPAAVSDLEAPIDNGKQDLTDSPKDSLVELVDVDSSSAGVSAEEAVLAEEDTGNQKQQAKAPEPEGLSVDDERLWIVPAANTGPSVLRFAEDIMPAREHSPDRGRKGGRAKSSKVKRR